MTAAPLLVVKDGTDPSVPNSRVLASAKQIRAAYEERTDRLWVATSAKRLCTLATEAGPTQRHRLLVLGPLNDVARELLAAIFRVVVARTPGRFLPSEQLFGALASPNADELFISATAHPEASAIVLQTADLRRLVVPLSWFRKAPGGPTPDPKHLRVTDYGRTVALGKYEAASDAILYDFDPEVRRRLKKRAISTDASLGGAIRRLRLQRGLSRSEFGELSEKTLARIERNENTPHESTLNAIARRLHVPIGELRTY